MTLYRLPASPLLWRIEHQSGEGVVLRPVGRQTQARAWWPWGRWGEWEKVCNEHN